MASAPSSALSAAGWGTSSPYSFIGNDLWYPSAQHTEPLAKDNLGVAFPAPLAKIIHGGVSCKIAAISATAAFPQRKKKEAKKKETLGRPVESAVAVEIR
jgi:hypothetical protein